MRQLIFADASAWFAMKNVTDAGHTSATQFMSQRPYLITTNYVIDETITLIRAHLGYRDAVDIFAFDEDSDIRASSSAFQPNLPARSPAAC